MNITLPVIILLLFALPVMAENKEKAPKTITINAGVSDRPLTAWRPSFSSLDHFVITVEPWGSTLLASRKTDSHYIAIFRTENDRLIFAKEEISSELKNGSILIRSQTGEELKLSCSMIPLIDFYIVSTSKTEGPTSTMTAKYRIFGYSFPIEPDLTGTFTLEYEAWNEGSGQPRAKSFVPFIWKTKTP